MSLSWIAACAGMSLQFCRKHALPDEASKKNTGLTKLETLWFPISGIQHLECQ